MIIVLGEIDYHPEDFETAKALAAIVMNETLKEDGCIQYAFAADLVHPNRLTLGELWRDDAALSAHLLTPHIQAFREGLKGVRVIRRVVQKHEVAATHDL
jgi:quinol monooxygenase YgiN